MRICVVLVVLTSSALADTAAPARTDARTLPVHALRGPFASPEAYCATRRRDDGYARACRVVRRLAHTAAIEIGFVGGQRSVALAIEQRGWWIDEGADHGDILLDQDRGRGGFALLALEDDANGARLRGVQAHWHKPLTDAGDAGDVYYCFALEVYCHARDAGAPVCTDALPMAGRRDCGLAEARDAARFDGSRWDWQQTLRHSRDGVEIRRRAWRDFPTRFDGYGDGMRELATRARALAGVWAPIR